MRATSLIPTLLALAATAAGAQCNQDPVARLDTIDFYWRPFTVAVTVNDSDPDGDALTVLNPTTTCNPGTVVTVDLDVLHVVPPPEQKTKCELFYQLSDGRGGVASGQVDVLRSDTIFADDFELGSPSGWEFGSGSPDDPPDEEDDLELMTAGGEV